MQRGPGISPVSVCGKGDVPQLHSDCQILLLTSHRQRLPSSLTTVCPKRVWQNGPELCRDTTAFWGYDRAQCKMKAKHTWTKLPSMICCQLFLSSVSAALHFSLALAARVTRYTDTVRKSNPRFWRELWETWVPLTVLPCCWRKYI